MFSPTFALLTCVRAFDTIGLLARSIDGLRDIVRATAVDVGPRDIQQVKRLQPNIHSN